MGIGRFAFLRCSPRCATAGLVDIGSAGLLAAMNYLGYLAGALWAAFSRNADPARRLAGGLVANVLTKVRIWVPRDSF